MTLTSHFTVACIRAAVVAALAMPGTLQAQTSGLDVLVVDSAGTPVPDARVEIAGVRGRARTNGNGVGRIDGITPGNRLVYASRLGFGAARVPVEFRPGERTRSTITLSSEAVTLATVRVVVGRNTAGLANRGFYERQRRGLGSYMDGDRIDELRPVRTVDLFRRMRGFQLVYDRRGYVDLQISRGAASLQIGCRPLIFLDGMLIPARTSPNEDALMAIHPESLAGIEAYAGPASIPAEYNLTGSACGVVLLWTRVGVS
jgi:hypothetical protein